MWEAIRDFLFKKAVFQAALDRVFTPLRMLAVGAGSMAMGGQLDLTTLGVPADWVGVVAAAIIALGVGMNTGTRKKITGNGHA